MTPPRWPQVICLGPFFCCKFSAFSVLSFNKNKKSSFIGAKLRFANLNRQKFVKKILYLLLIISTAWLPGGYPKLTPKMLKPAWLTYFREKRHITAIPKHKTANPHNGSTVRVSGLLFFTDFYYFLVRGYPVATPESFLQVHKSVPYGRELTASKSWSMDL